jgi:hypothetical protein
MTKIVLEEMFVDGHRFALDLDNDPDWPDRISIYIGPGWNIAKVLKRDLASVFVLLGRYLRKEGIEIEGIEK